MMRRYVYLWQLYLIITLDYHYYLLILVSLIIFGARSKLCRLDKWPHQFFMLMLVKPGFDHVLLLRYNILNE